MLTSPGPVWSKDTSTQHLGSQSQAFSELKFFADFLPKAFHVWSWLCHPSPQTAHDQVTVSVHKGRNLVFTSVFVQHHETTRKTLCQKGWVQSLSWSLALWACKWGLSNDQRSSSSAAMAILSFHLHKKISSVTVKKQTAFLLLAIFPWDSLILKIHSHSFLTLLTCSLKAVYESSYT